MAFISHLIHTTIHLKYNFCSMGKRISEFIQIGLNILFTLNPLI